MGEPLRCIESKYTVTPSRYTVSWSGSCHPEPVGVPAAAGGKIPRNGQRSGAAYLARSGPLAFSSPAAPLQPFQQGRELVRGGDLDAAAEQRFEGGQLLNGLELPRHVRPHQTETFACLSEVPGSEEGKTVLLKMGVEGKCGIYVQACHYGETGRIDV